MSACIFQAVGAFVICYLTKFKSLDCSGPTAGRTTDEKICVQTDSFQLEQDVRVQV